MSDLPSIYEIKVILKETPRGFQIVGFRAETLYTTRLEAVECPRSLAEWMLKAEAALNEKEKP